MCLCVRMHQCTCVCVRVCMCICVCLRVCARVHVRVHVRKHEIQADDWEITNQKRPVYTKRAFAYTKGCCDNTSRSLLAYTGLIWFISKEPYIYVDQKRPMYAQRVNIPKEPHTYAGGCCDDTNDRECRRAAGVYQESSLYAWTKSKLYEPNESIQCTPKELTHVQVAPRGQGLDEHQLRTAWWARHRKDTANDHLVQTCLHRLIPKVGLTNS